MQKRLTEEQQQRMIEVATREFGKHGFHAASINEIARGAGVSVGVIYKYYSDKKDLFDACLNSAVQYVDQLLDDMLEKGRDGFFASKQSMSEGTGAEEQTEQKRENEDDGTDDSLSRQLEYLIRYFLHLGSQEKDKLRMYHLITTNRAGFDDEMLASKLESAISGVFIKKLEEAQYLGQVRRDMEPSYLAIFLDDMLTTLLFGQCSPYYRARFDIYCGEDDGTRDEKLVQQLTRFLYAAFQNRE